MKNLVIAVLFILVVGLGIYVFKKEGITSFQELKSSVEKKVGDTVDSVKSKVESKLSTSSELVPAALVGLPEDTAFSLVLPAKAMAPALNHLINFIAKVKSSSLGKKLEIDKMMDEGLAAAKGGAEGTEQDAQITTASPSPRLEDILKTIQNFEKLDILLRAKTLEGKSTPLLKVNASFKDDAYSKQLQGILDGLVEMSKQGGGPELKKDPQDPLTYIANVKPPLAPLEAMARLKTAGKDINLTLGLIAGPAKATTTDSSDSNPANDTVIAQSGVSKEAFATYLNVANFRALLDVVLGLIPASQDPQQSEIMRKALDSSLGDYKALAASGFFDKGFQSKNCYKFNPAAKTFSPYKNAVAASKRDSQFYKLIGPRTTFAARIDGSIAAALIEGMSESLKGSETAISTQLAANPAAANPEVAAATGQMFAQLKMAEEEIKKLKIKDIGIVANAPTVSFVPDAGLYFEHEAGLTIDQFGSILQGIFKKLAPPSIAETSPISISKDSSGQTQVVFPVMEGYLLSFKSISPTQIFGSIQDNFTNEAKTLLAANESFVDDAKLLSKGISLKISKNDNFAYLSSSSLMPLIRQFTPFITMSKPELKINDTELTEFLDLFDFNLLATGEISSPEESMLCSENWAAVY